MKTIFVFSRYAIAIGTQRTRCFLYILSSLFLFASISYSQCSDAGVCTIGEKHDRNLLKKNTGAVLVSYTYGNGGSSDNFNTFKIGGEVSLSDNFSFSLTVPIMILHSSNQVYDPNSLSLIPSGTVTGLADAFIYLNYKKKSGKDIYYSLQGGMKVASSSFDKDNFKYYSAQGTYDLLLGFDFVYKFLNFSLGSQIPFSSYEDSYRTFARGADLFFRAGYFNQIKKTNLKLEFLGIKRLNKTKFTPLQTGGIYPVNTEFEIENSDFFQLNFLGGLGYNIAENITGDFNIGVPLLKRDENSDGTKRSITISAGFKFMFSM
jgi:hypothetical protein